MMGVVSSSPIIGKVIFVNVLIHTSFLPGTEIWPTLKYGSQVVLVEVESWSTDVKQSILGLQ